MVIRITSRVRHPSAEDFGAAYYRGRRGSNYQDYAVRQGRKLTWLPLLWLFRHVVRRYRGQDVAHLDVGCAYGYLLAYASVFVHRSVGVDLSPFAIREAQRRFPRLEFLTASATALPFPEGAFHVVSCFDTLEHIPNPLAAARELRRVLRPGGTLLLRMPYDGLYRRLLGWNDHDPTHVSVLSFAAWKHTLEETDFLIERSMTSPGLHGGNVVFRVRKPSA